MSTSSTLRPYARSIVTVGEHGGAHRVALRAGLSVLIPFLVLYAVGHVEWSIYAAFGAFTAVYGRNAPRAARLTMQSAAAAIMVATVVLGSVVALMPAREWAVVVVASLWAMVVAALSDLFRFAPPGPLFAVFGLCAIASVPGSVEAIGIAFVVGGASALLSLAIGQAGRLRASARRQNAIQDAAGQTSGAVSPVPAAPASRRLPRAGYIARYGVAAALAGFLSTALGIGHPYWAMVAAIVPLVATELPHAFVRGTHRVLGTVVGLGAAWSLLLAGFSGLPAILLIVALQMLAELFIVRNYGLALVFVTPLALLMINLVHPADPSALIADRGIETLLGTVVALLVACASWLISRQRLALTNALA